MSLLHRFIGRATPAAPAVLPRAEPVLTAAAGPLDTGGTGPGWVSELGWGGGRQSRVATLPRVTASIAERHATVFACCNVIAGDLAKVPLKLWQKLPDGREARVRQHALPYLLNVEASPGVPAMVPRYMLAYAFALRGNAYAWAPRDGAGEVELVETIRQDGCQVLRNGRARFYDFEDGAGVQRRAPARAMVHLRHMAADGWTGRSPLEVAAESVGLALAGQESAARVVSGATLRAALKMEDSYEDEETYRRNQRRIRNALTDPEAHGFPIIGANDEIQVLDLKAADQELLASRRFDREQLAAIWRVPPPKLQILEYGVKANSEQAAIDYLSDCLMYWGRLVEDQMALALLTEEERRAGLYLRHDFGALLRPTTRERYEALNRGIGGPFMTPNEGRAIEGLDPLPDGDRLNPAPNMTRPEAAASEEEDA